MPIIAEVSPWFDQRIQTDHLRTTDGRVVRVVFPGWWNLEAGPDFRHATVQIGDEPEFTGNVDGRVSDSSGAVRIYRVVP